MFVGTLVSREAASERYFKRVDHHWYACNAISPLFNNGLLSDPIFRKWLNWPPVVSALTRSVV